MRELVEPTGESQTASITIALRERLERLRGARQSDLAARLLAIDRDCAAHLSAPYCTLDHGDLLYDEYGLPR